MPSPSPRPLRGKRLIWLLAAMTALVAVAGAAIAVAKSTKKPTALVKTARNASLKEAILVDSRGRTLYELRPETSKHLLCVSSQCLGFWPPAKVGAKTRLAKGTGVHGSLGRLHRRGFDQLTLDGRPLYRFSGDRSKGSAAGQGIVGFGGTWHVVKTSGSSTTTHTTTTSTSMSNGSTSSSNTTTQTTSTNTSTSTSTSTSSTYTYPPY